MKFRPQFQLRFRSADQFTRLRKIAEREGVALNEWLLRRVEDEKQTGRG